MFRPLRFVVRGLFLKNGAHVTLERLLLKNVLHLIHIYTILTRKSLILLFLFFPLYVILLLSVTEMEIKNNSSVRRHTMAQRTPSGFRLPVYNVLLIFPFFVFL